MLRTVTTDRVKVGELMMWCIDHAEYSEEVNSKFKRFYISVFKTVGCMLLLN